MKSTWIAVCLLAAGFVGIAGSFDNVSAAGAPAKGIWMDPAELAELPTSGAAWTNLLSKANQTCSAPNLSDQEDAANVCVLAKALVFARTGQESYRLRVVDAIWAIVNSGPYSGRALALGRELGTYPIAADLIDLGSYDPGLDQLFRAKLVTLLTTKTVEGPTSLIDCHETRPNNWGLHCGATRAAIASYLKDNVGLARVAQVFQGWLGNRASYAGFSYGDTSWQCDPTKPVGINPKGCSKNGYSIDGVLPDDQRRSETGFVWPPPQENYVWEGLQGALAQAVILQRGGYPAFAWSDSALLRAFQWLHTQAKYPASGDDSWEPFIANYFYASAGAAFPASTPTQVGKMVGFTDWTHKDSQPSPVLAVSPTNLIFSAVANGPSPAGLAVQVSNAGSGAMGWSATVSDARWTVSPSSGSGNGGFTVAPSISGLAAGTYTAQVSIVASGAAGSPATVSLSLTLTNAPSRITSINVAPNPVAAGASAVGIVTISPAPASSVAVGLSSSSSAIGVPSSVTVAAGTSSATFAVTGGSVSTTQTAVITGSLNGTMQTSVTVNPVVAPSKPAPTEPVPPPADSSSAGSTAGGGIWISASELASKPMSGTAWTALKKAADKTCSTPNLSDQEDAANVCVMAKALVYARTGTASYRASVVSAISSIANSGTYSGRALALGRELGTYVISADLIGLKSYDSALDNKFRTKLQQLLTTKTDEGPTSLINCHETRPNNWGTHCGTSRLAIALYLGDTAQVARIATIFRGWLGDRSAYASFSWGGTEWQCDPSKPVAINPTGCKKDGHSIDGVLPDDQRRSETGFVWPPPQENYVYEALQGALPQAVMLQRAGYTPFAWSDQALKRAFTWLHNEANYAPTGDDKWESYIVNYYYRSTFPVSTSITPGKNVGFTDFTHK